MSHPLPKPSPRPTPTSTQSPASGPQPAGWGAVVAIHAVLILFAVSVVWVTLGRDPKGAASGASRVAPTVPAATVEAPPTVTPKRAEVDRTAAAAPDRRPFLTGDGKTFEEPAAAPVEADLFADESASTSASPMTLARFAVPATISRADEAIKGSAPATVQPLATTSAIPTTLHTTTPSADGFATHGQLYGLPGAQRVVYLVDASGSLVDSFPFILDELRRCITNLQPEQTYAVLFFRGDEVVEAPPLGMHRADTHTLARTVRWLDPKRQPLIPNGTARPDAALRRALAYNPDAIVLVSDDLTGRIDPEGDRLRILQLIDAANLGHAVIHTAQLRHRDTMATPERLGTLELIAFVTGGTHRYIREDDLVPASDVAVDDSGSAIDF